MQVILDRIEENIAICEKEDGSTIEIDKKRLPKKAKSGDVLLVYDYTIIIDEKETMNRKKIISDLADKLFE